MTETTKQIEKLLNVSEACAYDIQYLRSRSRWSQELEDELVRLYESGTPPNMCEFGCTAQTKQLQREALSDEEA